MLVALWLLQGCGPKSTAVFDQYGYLNDAYHYRVVTTSQQLMGQEWLLDNFYRRGRDLEAKSAAGYLIDYLLDTNGDGKPDRTEQTFLYDLRFTHRAHDAHVWLRTIPMSTRLREMELRVLAQRYVDAVAGSGFEAVRLDNGSVVGESQRFAAKLLERGPAKVAGQQAYRVTFDVVNVDEETVKSGSRTDRVSIVLIRPPFDYVPPSTGPRVSFPAVMLAGYANLPEDFAKDVGSFDQFVGRIQFGETIGYQQSPLERLTPDTTS
ncbi:MAG TPA: hypothetical protein VIV60_15450, partial [Polyangiaceae bacterium]